MRFLNAAPSDTARLEAVVAAEVRTDAGVVVAQGKVGVAIRVVGFLSLPR